MKRRLFLLFGSAVLAFSADLTGVKTVYVMPMARGLDQYLASRLTSDHVFQVVTDPKLADAVMTDRIGEAFQMRLESFFPAPENGARADAKEKAAKDREEEDASNATVAAAFGDPANKLENPALNSTFGRGRGTIFLVEARSKQVVWSTFDPSKNNTARELDRTASDIVSRLKKDLRPGSK